MRCATLAPNGHNTQPWLFELSPGRISIRPDFSRRTAVVDPDDHHIWVSLGCATENMVIAAAALGKHAEVQFDPQEIRVTLDNGPPENSPLVDAIFERQCTRADPANWFEVGRAYEHFALTATVLGVRTAFVNQPIEVPAVRSPFAAWLGIGSQRPDLVVRLGRGPLLPYSLRRPVAAVIG